MALDAEDQKRLYENLETIRHMLDDDYQNDAFFGSLLAFTGLEIDDNGHTVLDPTTRDDANRVLVRWLRDRRYLPPARSARRHYPNG